MDQYAIAEKRIAEQAEILYEQAKSTGRPAENLCATLSDAQGNTLSVLEVYEIDTSSLTSSYTHDPNEISRTYIAKANISDHNTRTGQDETGNVYGTVTIYLNLQGQPTQYLLTRIAGSYSAVGVEGVVVHSQTVNYACNGAFPTPVNNQTGTKYPGVNASWSYTTGFSQYVTAYLGFIGADVTYTLRRGSTDPSTFWTFTLQNRV